MADTTSSTRVVLEDLRRSSRRRSANVRGYLGGSTEPRSPVKPAPRKQHHYQQQQQPKSLSYSLKSAVATRNPLSVSHKPRFLVLDSSYSEEMPAEGLLRRLRRSSASSVASSSVASTCPSTCASLSTVSETSDHRGHTRPRRPKDRLLSSHPHNHHNEEEDSEDATIATQSSSGGDSFTPFVVELSEQLGDLDESYMLSVFSQADSSVSSVSNNTSSTCSSLRSTRRRHKGASSRRGAKRPTPRSSTTARAQDPGDAPPTGRSEETLPNPFRDAPKPPQPQAPPADASPQAPAPTGGWHATMRDASEHLWKDWTMDRGWLHERRAEGLFDPDRPQSQPPPPPPSPRRRSTHHHHQQDVSWFSAFGHDREDPHEHDADDRRPILGAVRETSES